jgi:hypothetical protein
MIYKKGRLGTINIILMLSVVVLGIVVGLYLLLRAQTVVEVQTGNDLSDWKTYTSSELELSFLYPSSVKEPEIKKSILNELNKYEFIDVNTNCIEILISRVLSSRTPEDYIRYDFAKKLKNFEWNEYKINHPTLSNNIIKIGEEDAANLGPLGENGFDNFFVKHGKYIYQIQVMESGFSDEVCLNEYNKILSTFKFIK